MNTNTTHTPGPWQRLRTVSDKIVIISDHPAASYFHIAEMGTHDGDEVAQENARLIAAAPELLEALKGIIEGGNLDHGTYWQVDVSDIDKARAAITKAEGRAE